MAAAGPARSTVGGSLGSQCVFAACSAPCSKRLEAVQRRQVELQALLQAEHGNLGGLEARVAQLEAVRRGEDARLKGLRKEVGGRRVDVGWYWTRLLVLVGLFAGKRDHVSAMLCASAHCAHAPPPGPRQVDTAKKEQFKAGQALFALRQRERELISEISGAAAWGRPPYGHAAQPCRGVLELCSCSVLQARAGSSTLISPAKLVSAWNFLPCCPPRLAPCRRRPGPEPQPCAAAAAAGRAGDAAAGGPV